MSLANAKDVYGTFQNDSEWVQVIFDISASDTGTIGDYDVFTAKNDLVILDFYADIQATCSSANGTAVFDLGVGDGGTEILSDHAVSGFVADTLHGQDTAAPVRVASGSKIVMGIETQNVHAGKIAFNFLVKKVA